MIDPHKYQPDMMSEDEWATAKCDKYDYLIAAFCGGTAGLVDVFFVGDPLTSVLGNSVDKVADGFVKKAAQLFWTQDKRTKGKPKKMPESLVQCISYLEQAFPVNYDARYAIQKSTKIHYIIKFLLTSYKTTGIFLYKKEYLFATFSSRGKLSGGHLATTKVKRKRDCFSSYIFSRSSLAEHFG
ncbi:hypothetical protein [Butyrivibrio sp. AE3004]|uniref:hypothetical protein n=1 Tax=Butyrivibrio sp. AE3004 TaxID=1506994 RepID=UPI00069238F1|nr:hypothetical protein [Butyrivibrio sp. AE3004]